MYAVRIGDLICNLEMVNTAGGVLSFTFFHFNARYGCYCRRK